MANFQAESGGVANIAQRGMTKLTDAEYTALYDSNPELCYRDGVGYGLYQLTYWTRKRAFAEYAHARGKSVGDEDTQVQFCIKELKEDYATIFNDLCTSSERDKLTDLVCDKFENPAVNNFATRRNFAKEFYKELVTAAPVLADAEGANFPPNLSILLIQHALNLNNYTCNETGYWDKNTKAKLREFVEDVNA